MLAFGTKCIHYALDAKSIWKCSERVYITYGNSATQRAIRQQGFGLRINMLKFHNCFNTEGKHFEVTYIFMYPFAITLILPFLKKW